MISYTDSIEDLTPEHLQGFFAGWRSNRPTPDLHLRILRGSHSVILARDSRTGKVVGCITALTDGVLAAFITLLEVLPEYRGRGIGSELMRRMLSELQGLQNVDLMCDPDLQPFYARFGMEPAHGMVVRRYGRQERQPILGDPGPGSSP